MCAAHREYVLDKAKERLSETDLPLLIIATNLIEAGVDISLPVVYRALAGLDSIAQAAGRCNREGKLDGLGRAIVFNPPRDAPPGLLRDAQQITRDMLPDLGVNPLSPANLRRFFERLHHRTDTDPSGIMKLLTPISQLHSLQFRSAAEAFEMIDQSSQSIIVPWSVSKDVESPVYQWLAELENDRSKRQVYRKLQRYAVSIPEPLIARFVQKQLVAPVVGQWLLSRTHYDLKRGLKLPDDSLSPELSVI